MEGSEHSDESGHAARHGRHGGHGSPWRPRPHDAFVEPLFGGLDAAGDDPPAEGELPESSHRAPQRLRGPGCLPLLLAAVLAAVGAR